MVLSITDLDIANKKVFIRCDFNTPMDEFCNITDDRRIISSIPTIKYCLDRNCKIILASHLGRPKNGFEKKYSLEPVAKRLSRLLNKDIKFFSDEKEAKECANNLKNGEILLLENLRFNEQETKDGEEFAKNLASMAEFYINDAFGVSHRAHASVHKITTFFDKNHKGAGFLLQKEIEFASNLIKNPTRPFVSVVGGSKVSSKLSALKNLLTKVDKLIIGGGMAFTFLKAVGYDTKKSLVEDDLIDSAKEILKDAKKLGVKIYLPVDCVVANEISGDAKAKEVPVQEIPENFMGLDIGLATITLFKEALSDAGTIWWNGPMGVYEIEKFAKGSIKLSHAIAELNATSVVGGGDTADLVKRANDDNDFTFVSTGGGASLELIEGKILPGIEVLQKG